MKTKIRIPLLVVLLATAMLTFNSCYKEGIGGKSTISGTVTYNGKPVAYAVVYIKFGGKEFPGVDASLYDAHSTCDLSGYYDFHDLRRGDYYLYAVGYDNVSNMPVRGNGGLKLKFDKSIGYDIPLSQ